MEFKNEIVQASDIHWCKEYRNFIIKPMMELIEYTEKNKPKYVVISGDYFEKRVDNDDPLFTESIGYILRLAFNCKHLIIIKGTQSHDNFTLSILKEFQKTLSNLHYYETLTIDEIEGDKWLLIPEEYPENPNEYYKDIYKENIDYIVGHGELEGAMLHSGIDNRRLKGWKFNVNLLETTGCKWNMWGHIHKPQQLSDKTFYAGSLSRTKFGEEERKGFRVYDCDGFNTKFVETLTSNKFITIKSEEAKDILNNEDKLEELKKEDVFVRFHGEKDEEVYKTLNETLNKEITFKNSIKGSKKDEEILNNKLLFENITDKDTREQYLEVLNDELKNGKLTKKKKEILESEEFVNKISFLLNEIK